MYNDSVNYYDPIICYSRKHTTNETKTSLIFGCQYSVKMESMCLRLQLVQSAMTCPSKSLMVKVNAGSVKVNQILSSSKTRAYTHLWNVLQGSWSLQPRYRSSRGFAVRAEAAAGFPVSYESSETNNKSVKMVGSNAKEFVASQTGGPDIGDGDGHGGHGHEGNGGGNNNNNNNNNNDGYGDLGKDDNKLINTVWWLILQCIRMLRTTITMCVSGRPEQVWLAMVEKAFEFVAADLMMTTGLTASSLVTASVFALAEVTVILFYGFVNALAQLEIYFGVVIEMMLAGFVAVTAGLSWALLSLRSNSDIFPHLNDENEDDNDYNLE